MDVLSRGDSFSHQKTQSDCSGKSGRYEFRGCADEKRHLPPEGKLHDPHRSKAVSHRHQTGPPQETPRVETAREIDDARLHQVFDAVHPRTPRDRVIIEQTVTYLARKRQNVFVKVEELETHILFH